MWINQETYVVSLAYAHDFANVVQVFLVVTTRTFVFYSLPRHQEPHKSEPARLDAAEVLVGSVEWKRSSDKRDIFVVEEPRGLMRPTIDWEFGGSGHVYASQKNDSLVSISEKSVGRTVQLATTNLRWRA